MIHGLVVKPLQRFVDDRGAILKMQQSIDEEFVGFGEIYFSIVNPGKIKGWHLHQSTTVNYAAIHGNIKLVLFDNREDSATEGNIEELYIGDNNYCLVQIPPGIWSGFMGLGEEPAILADLTNKPYDSQDTLRLELNHNDIISYCW